MSEHLIQDVKTAVERFEELSMRIEGVEGRLAVAGITREVGSVMKREGVGGSTRQVGNWFDERM